MEKVILPRGLTQYQDLRLKLMAISATHVPQQNFSVILRIFTVFKIVA